MTAQSIIKIQKRTETDDKPDDPAITDEDGSGSQLEKYRSAIIENYREELEKLEDDASRWRDATRRNLYEQSQLKKSVSSSSEGI